MELFLIASQFAVIFFLVAVCHDLYTKFQPFVAMLPAKIVNLGAEHVCNNFYIYAEVQQFGAMIKGMILISALDNIYAEIHATFLTLDTPYQRACACLFLALFVAKYLKTFVGCFTYTMFKGRPISDKPKYKSWETAVIVPTTFADPEKLLECVSRIMESRPGQIFVVTHQNNVRACDRLLQFIHIGQIRVLGVAMLNKRVQILTALNHVTAEIVILADDDVFWPSPETDRVGRPISPDYLDLLLAIFEDDHVGAGGTRQRVRRQASPCTWNFLGIGYLERRTWNNATTNAIDGSISTLSGRTAAYRAEILQTREFRHYFLNDSWRGRPLNSDDDKCLTRYVYKHGWDIAIQFDHRAVLETTVEIGPKYLQQCLRWARAHWRGNYTVMETETYWRSLKMFWGTYVIYFGSFLTPTILWEILLAALLWDSIGISGSTDAEAFTAFFTFIIASKLVKYVPHFLRYPQDLMFVPVAIAFSYFHGFLNIYAAMTMTTTHWGSQNLGAESEASRGMAMAPQDAKGLGTRFSVGGSEHFRARACPGAKILTKWEIAAMGKYLLEMEDEDEVRYTNDIPESWQPSEGSTTCQSAASMAETLPAEPLDCTHGDAYKSLEFAVAVCVNQVPEVDWQYNKVYAREEYLTSLYFGR